MSGTEDEPRIGVFVCHCGHNIAGTVDVEAVAHMASNLPGVAFAADEMFMCSDAGQTLIKEKIKEHNLNRVVVASCSPRMHEPTFRRVVEEAGLNRYLFDQVNLREHVSWCHMREPELALRGRRPHRERLVDRGAAPRLRRLRLHEARRERDRRHPAQRARGRLDPRGHDHARRDRHQFRAQLRPGVPRGLREDDRGRC